MPQIIVTASIKGGTGKSTTTVLLSRHLAERGRRVLVVDMDPQASCTDYYLRTEQADTIAAACTYQLLTERADLADILRPGVLGLDIAPSAPILATADLELATDPGALLRFRDAITSGGHDVILIDTPPVLSAGMRAALYAADLALVPVQLDRWTLQGLGMLHSAAVKATRTTGRPCPVLCVPSIVSPKEAEDLRTVLAKYDITKTAIPRSASVRKALAKAGLPGKGVLEAVEALAAEIVEG